MIFTMVLLLAGCSFPQTEVTPEGNLEILGSSTEVDGGLLSSVWVAEGLEQVANTRDIVSVEKSGAETTVEIRANPRRYVLIRRITANLLTSPFLTWSWNAQSADGSEPGIRMIVGFVGGNPRGPTFGRRHAFTAGTRIPAHDRRLAIAWSHSEQEQGVSDRDAPLPVFVARSGAGDYGSWRTENINLAEIYRSIWPEDDLVRARIIFVGFASPAGNGRTKIAFSDINLYR